MADADTKSNSKALAHLTRFQALVISAYLAEDASPAAQRDEIAWEATYATVLSGPPSRCGSRQQALLAIAEQADQINLRREISHADVVNLMSAIEASWGLDPNVPLDANCVGRRAVFDRSIAQLKESSAR